MAFCPNLSDPDIKLEFDILKSRVGENMAYTLWDRHEGDVNFIYQEIALRQEEVAKRRIAEQYSQDQDVIEAIEKYGTRVIHNGNNPKGWAIEKELGLLEEWTTLDDGTRRKLHKLFTYGVAERKAKQVREKGGQAAITEVYTRSRNTNRKYKVIVFYDIGMPESQAAAEDIAFEGMPEDANRIRGLVANLDPKQGMSTLDFLDKVLAESQEILDKRGDLKFVLDLINQNRDKLQDSKIFSGVLYQVDPFGQNVDWAYMKHRNGHIVINEGKVYDRPNMEYFTQSIFHEIIHAMTVNAYNNNETALEKEFVRKIDSLYFKMVEERPDLWNTYGMRNQFEFLSEMFTNRQFQRDLHNMKINKEDTRSTLQKIIDFILNLLGRKTIKQKDSVLTQGMEVFRQFVMSTEHYHVNSDKFAHATATQAVFAEDAGRAIAGNPEAIRDAIRAISKNFKFDAKTHTYTYIPTGEVFTSVTEHMKTYGYGIVEDLTDLQTEKLERASKIGTSVHLTMEGHVNDIVKDIEAETGFKMSKQATVQLKQYLEDLKKDSKSVIAMSEVILGDPETKRAGTVDLILIDDKGRIRIFDFKNKEKGFRYYTSEKYGHSDRTKYRLQASIYKHMLEKFIGVEVYDMNIVHFRPTVTGNTIEKVVRDRSYDSSGMDSFRKMAPQFKRIYGEKRIKFGKASALTEKLEADEQSSYFDYKFHKQKVSNEQLTDVEQLAEKAKQALINRYKIVQAKYSLVQRQDFENFMEEMLEIDNATDTLLSIIEYSAKVTNGLIAEHNALIESGEDYDIQQLNKWRDYLLAYESLGQIQDMIKKDKKLFKDPKITKVLSQTIENRRFLMNLYETEGKKLIARWLTPYYNGIRKEAEDRLVEEYRRQVFRKKKKGMSKDAIIEEIGTKEEFVEKLLEERNMNLDEMTYDLLLSELTVAGRDINTISRWIDNMLDTADPVAAAMVNAFVEAADKSRVESLEKRTELVNQLRAIEKARGKKVMQSELDFYSFILEMDEKGRPNQYLLMPWKSELHERERDERSKLYKDFTREEAESRMTAWRKAHLKLDEEDYDDALNEYLIGLMKEEIISQEDYDNIMRNQLVSKLPMHAIVASGEVSEQAADLALRWMGENRWKFSEIHEDYQSDQWKKWIATIGINPNLKQWQQMDAVQNSTHPEAVFYNYITNLAREADSMLPYSHRLGYRLPGVAKRNNERIKEGQDPITYFKETARLDILVRAEDVERGSKELTDEQGNPKYFLPIHYTAKIEPQNQSYDIAGIYYKYWDSANDYRNKREILSEMEMTKFFINNRSAVKRNAMGEIIRRAASTVGIEQDEKSDEPSLKRKTQLSDQFNDWFEMAVYGKYSKEGSIIKIWGHEIDAAKLADGLGRYTSINLLAGNVAQGTANIILGETMQAIDAFAGEYVSAKSLTQGTDYYMRNLPKMMADIGARDIESTAGKLIERFDILHEDPALDTNFARMSRAGQLLNTGSLYFIQHAGEHWMQSRFLFAMLKEKRAFDKDTGEDIGSMLDQYYTKNGKLKIRERVDLEKSKWTEKDQQQFKRKVKGILSRMHGEYSDLGRVALQRLAIGRLAFAFRKFVMPGWKRRWSGRRYIQRLDQFVEGNYITTGRFAKTLIEDLATMKLTLMAEDWAALSDHEKANIKRTLGEVAFLTAAIILAAFVFNLDGDDEDDWFKGFMSYQVHRLQSELLFFINPGDAMAILRSPMASMSILENIGRLLNQLLSPGEVYERGPWKGQLKIKRTMVNFVPLYKQYYRLRDIDEQIKWFSR